MIRKFEQVGFTISNNHGLGTKMEEIKEEDEDERSSAKHEDQVSDSENEESDRRFKGSKGLQRKQSTIDV